MKKTITIKDKYTVHVHLELRENKDNKPIFSCCADCNRLHVHGQCLDDINPYMNNTLWRIIYALWKKHHLNNMHVGTERQEQQLVNDFGEDLDKISYTDRCNWLRRCGLLDDNGYVYGHGWVYKEIPTDDLAVIKAIIKA